MNIIDTTPLLTHMAAFPAPLLLPIQALVPPNTIQLGLLTARYQCQPKRLRIYFLTSRKSLGFNGTLCVIWWVDLSLQDANIYFTSSV